MPIYCDESGGIGRGVMTLAAIHMDEDKASALVRRFRDVTGYHGELKGSRIDLAQRALIFELFEKLGGRAMVGIAISATQVQPGTDRGRHDITVYAALLNQIIAAMLMETGPCASIIIDDGRYAPDILALIKKDVTELIGPCSRTEMFDSHMVDGLQIADVIANTFFNRALVSDRQARMAAITEPFMESGRIKMRLLPPDK